MRFSPSIAPAAERDIYMVLDDYGNPLGRAWPEMDEAHTEQPLALGSQFSAEHLPRRFSANANQPMLKNAVSSEQGESKVSSCCGSAKFL